MREMGEKNKEGNKTPCAKAMRLKEQEEKLNPQSPYKAETQSSGALAGMDPVIFCWRSGILLARYLLMDRAHQLPNLP